MIRPTRGQLLAAGAAVVVLFGIRVARQTNDPAAVTPGASNSLRTAATRSSVPELPVEDVKLELLRSGREELGISARDPFRFQPRTPPPAPRSARVEKPQAPTAVAPPVPTGPPPPPPIPLKFIGVLETSGRAGSIAILSDSRGNVFYGKEGDIIDGRYKMLKVGAEAAEVSYTDGRGRQTLRLSGQ
jgi:hypothetical protein